MSDNPDPTSSPALSQTFRDAFLVAAAAAATVGALDLILSSARSSSQGFLASVRHADDSAAASRAQVAASVSKILGSGSPPSDAGRPRLMTSSAQSQSRQPMLPYGAPVVT